MSDIQYVYPLIHNKVTPPHYVTPTLRRPRLLEWLSDNANCRAIVIAADAGYGKTTLLWQWEREVDFPCYWYKLDRNDRDWSLHISYLIEAISQRHSGFGRRAHSMLQQLGGPGSSRPGVAAYLLAEMYERLKEPCTFIIDDWQAVASVTEVRGLWNQILRDAPPTCRFVFLSRAKPHLQFARFKTHAGYAEIRTDALRFTDREIDELFRDIYNDPLDPTELLELERRTEGWAASLQLVEVSLRERKTPEERRAFIQSITATTDSDLFAFLAEEVLDQQTELVRNFLLSTSILQQINAELAERLAGVHDGAGILSDLEQRGLFTNRLDAAEARYRYHGLFRDFLERRLIAERTDGEVTGLHIHAASYFETHEQWPQAIHHYLKAGLTPQAARLIARYGEDVVSEGRLGLVDEWLQQLPAKAIRDNARLSLLYGEACGIRGDWDNALTALGRARTYFARKGDPRMEALACLKTSSIHQALGSVSQAEVAAGEGMALVPESAGSLRLRLEGNLAVTKTYRTQSIDAVVIELRRLAVRASSLGLEHYEAIAHHNLGVMYRSLGRLDESLASLERATRFWQLEPSSPYADNMDLVETLLALGDMERADRAAGRGIANTLPWRRANAEAQLGQASVRLRQGRLDDARGIVEGIAAALPELGSNRTAVYVALADCFIARPQTRPATIDLIAHLEKEADDPRYEAEVAVAIVSLRHAINSCDGSCRAASAIVEQWDHHGQHFETVKRRALLALAALDHDPETSSEVCGAALSGVVAANQTWYLRFFLRPFAAVAGDLVSHAAGAEALCELLEADPDAWRRAVVAALPMAKRDVRPKLLEALATDPSSETIEELRAVRGHDVEEVRARLIRVAAARIHVRAFGSIRIRRGSADGSEVAIHRPRQRTLLGYLLARVDNPPSRDQVIETLWPNSEPEDGVNSLNQSVYQLRRVIDPGYRDGESPQYLISTTDTVALDGSLVTTDLQAFRVLTRAFDKGAAVDVRALGNELVDLIGGEFLAELVYEDWATSFRMAVHAEVRQVLMRLTDEPWLASYPDLGLRAAARIADLDPYDEQAHLAMARCLQVMGRREAARRLIRRFLTRLRDDLGESPEADFSPYVAGEIHLTGTERVK
jgi:ATP/maltotriose-dependent transcriptional regulator MalT/DNA-binding SARP family transcriptional activator